MPSNKTLAAAPMRCDACGEAIEAGERVQRASHWRCYIAARRAGALATLPLAKTGRPVGKRR